MTDLAAYCHTVLFYPTISTLTKVLAKGNLLTWPRIDKIKFKYLLGTTIPLEKGHLDQERINFQSTSLSELDTTEDHFPYIEKK